MEEKQRIRKVYSKDGRGQKAMCFRIDLENKELLQTVANKGKLVNDLLREYFAASNKDESQHDRDPAGDTSEDTMP